MSIKDYFWPANNNYYLQGNLLSDNLSYINLKLIRWNPANSKGIQCKSKQDIDSFISNVGVGIFTASSYFDFDDFSDPVKHYVNDGLYFYFAPGFTKLVSIYVKENSYELSDSIFRYEPSTAKNKFISTDDFNVDLKKEDDDGTVLQVMYIKDK